jgi:nucleoside phosphorylase
VQAEAQQKPPTVFISYAHESNELRASVKALADWLIDCGCSMLTDHPYVYRPPEQGWPVWMHDCVEKADVVLVVCTPKLKARYEKNEEPDTGCGATFEGAIVTQHIYDAAMRNTKFFPIIPDSGSYDDVPTALRPWWNGHSFPLGYEGIRCMIFNELTDANRRSTGPQDNDLDTNRRMTWEMSHAKALGKTAAPRSGAAEQRALVVTALPVEFKAVCDFLSDRREHMLSHGAICEVGRFQEAGANWVVAVLEIGPGNERAASEMIAAILGLNPDIALFVGVAGGLKDVALGDVVAATKVYGYESGKDAASFLPRPEVFRSSYVLEQRARAISRNVEWASKLGSVGDGSRQPRSFVGPIAAGSKVVASRRSMIFRLLQQTYGDALAVEMEGVGFLAAAFPHADVPALVVRGISDLIGGKAKTERHGSQEIASRNAAAFAFAVLSGFQTSTDSRASGGSGWEHATKSNTQSILPKKVVERLPDNESAGDQARRQENERRLKKLRNEIGKKLKSSKAALVELEAAMGFSAPTGASLTDERRADRLVDDLMDKKDFLAGKTALLQAYEKLQDQDRHDGADAIRRVSRLLIPWLYVTGFPACRQLDDDWWQKGLPGDVLILPARLKTFAEIVMAGLDRREVKHRNDDELWPTGALAVRLEQPESGIADTTEDNLRTDLFRMLKAPMDHAKSDPSTQDGAIIGQLKYWAGKGFTPYLICDQFSNDEQERRGHEDRLKRISGKYPGLAIVELGGLMEIDDQDVFNEIRDLLLPYEP